MKRMLTTLPINRPPTLAELDAEAQEWGYETWDEFYDAVDDELIRREEMEGFELYATGVVDAPTR
jgi:hypothetical protein